MLNIEKYKDKIMKYRKDLGLTTSCAIHKVIDKRTCTNKCNQCMQESIYWLFKEYKEPILDDVEKLYLKILVNPFRDKVLYIQKASIGTDNIRIVIKNDNPINLPCFQKDTMYKGMKAWEKYTLEDLGI